MLYIFHFDSID